MLAGLGRSTASQPADSFGEAIRLYNLGWSWRVLGRIDHARVALTQALKRFETQPISRNLLMTHHELSVCAAAAGEFGEAHAALGRFEFFRARLATLDLDAVQALVREAGPVPGGLIPLPGLQPQPAHAPGSDARLRATEPPCLQRAENLYLAHLPRRLPLASLAEQAGVALRTLQDAARSYRQVTLTDMLRRQVMNEALTRVLHSDLPLKDIGEQLGYHEAASFSRDFKRVHGAAPSVYRSVCLPAHEAVQRGAAQGPRRDGGGRRPPLHAGAG
jgi:AraC-like DNA-binding protein